MTVDCQVDDGGGGGSGSECEGYLAKCIRAGVLVERPQHLQDWLTSLCSLGDAAREQQQQQPLCICLVGATDTEATATATATAKATAVGSCGDDSGSRNGEGGDGRVRVMVETEGYGSLGLAQLRAEMGEKPAALGEEPGIYWVHTHTVGDLRSEVRWGA
jgi:hypothetical protein